MIVEISTEHLQKIADYYGFPVAVFFASEIPEGTRDNNIKKNVKEFENKLKELIEEHFPDYDCPSTS